MRSDVVKIIHTVLRADFGLLDRNLVRSELLREPGVEKVSFEKVALTIKYDPTKVDDSTLIGILHRYGAFTGPASPPPY